MSEKRCPRCTETKAIDCFGLTSRVLAGGRKVIRQTYCKACRVAMQVERDKANPDALSVARRRMKLRRNYGITPEQHAAQISRQGGDCAICKRALAGLSPQTVHVDHCHATGALRGILCGPCNTGLGNFRDSEASLMSAIEYLRAGGAWTQARAA